MNVLKIIFCWFVGLTFFAGGMIGFTESDSLKLPSAAVLICSFLILPPVHKRLGLPTWALALVLVAGFVGLRIIEGRLPKSDTPTITEKPSTNESDNNQEQARKISNDVNYGYINARRAIKRQLKDPDSFEEINHECGYVGKDGIYVACLITYRSRNSFNGMVIEKALALYFESATSNVDLSAYRRRPLQYVSWVRSVSS